MYVAVRSSSVRSAGRSGSDRRSQSATDKQAFQSARAFARAAIIDMFEHYRQYLPTFSSIFTRVSILTDTQICLSVRYVPVGLSGENGLTYRHRFSTVSIPIILVLSASNT